MSGVILCSMQSTVPYYIKDLDINIYSIEELAYYLYHHVYLIDDDFFNDNLIEYIGETLGQKRIANGIRQAKLHRSTLMEIISFVVKSASYYSPEELSKLQHELEIIGNKSGIERLKAKGDILLNCKKYNNAFECYKYILMCSRGTNLPNHFYGNIYNNMGVICVNMFKYQNAINCFRQGYKISRDILILKQLVMADMLNGNEKILEDDIRTFKVSQHMVDECRKKLEYAKNRNQGKLQVQNSTKEVLDNEIDKWIHDYKSDH